MPYGDATAGPMAQYLRPMYLPAIEGIQNAQTQGRWEQVQEEEKRKWEANRPFVDAQAKQMQFAANKAETAGNIWNSLQGGKGSPERQAAGVSPSEFTRAYLGMHAANPEIEADIPNLGRVKAPVKDLLEFFAKQKAQGETVPINYQGRIVNIPVADLKHFVQQPKEPQYETFNRVGPDGKVFAETRVKSPGIVPDIYKPGEKEKSYSKAQMIDDVKGLYQVKFQTLGNPAKWYLLDDTEQKNAKKIYDQTMLDLVEDISRANQGKAPMIMGGITMEQEKDSAFLDQIRQALGGQPAQQPPQYGGNPQYGVAPGQPTQQAVSPTVTIERGGKYYLIPTLVGGKQLSPDDALMEAMVGRNNPVGEFNSKEEANVAARLHAANAGTR